MNKQAIRPNFLNVPILQKDKEAEKRGASEDERALYSMSQGRGWELFSTHAAQLLSELDELNTKAIETGATYEELGRNTLVISMTKDIIKRLLNKVEDAKESCEGEGE